MARIPVIAAGSYYATRSPAAGPNAQQMRGLIWYVKDNRAPGTLTSSFRLEHPAHSSRAAWSIASPTIARDYAADLLWSTDATRRVVVPQGVTPLLVPIPSSKIVRATMNTGRWPALEIARRLEAKGAGHVIQALAHRVAREESKGRQKKTREFVENFDVLYTPNPWEYVVFVDDVVTWGETLAAADISLQTHGRSGAVVVGATHSMMRNAYDVLHLTVDYATAPGPDRWDVRISAPI